MDANDVILMSMMEIDRARLLDLDAAILARLSTMEESAVDPNIRAGQKLATFVEATTQKIKLEDWQQMVCARLDKLRVQKGQRLLLHGPPQYGKSILVSQRFPAYLIGNAPEIRIRLACYNITHATRFSKVNLDVMRSPEYRRMFPSPKVRMPNICQADEWSTPARAGNRDAQPSFAALGIGSGFVGLGADTFICDDPYKNRDEAFSPIINGNIWNWWNEVVVPRLNEDSNVVVMFHRWKEDDLAGRLLQQGGWDYLRFAAIGDGENDPMERAIGVPLSSRYPRAYLDNVKRTIGNSAFESLYQGNPKPREGNMFKWSFFDNKIIHALPVEIVLIRYWDKGFTADGGAYTCGVLMGRTPIGEFIIIDEVRGQWSSGVRDEMILQTAQADKEKYGDGKVTIWIEQEPGSTGRDSCRAIITKLAGYAIYADKVTGDKETRAEPFASQCEVGNVRIMSGTWNRPYLDELTSFPNGTYKDRVDASSGAFNKLTEGIVHDFDIYDLND